MNRFFKIKYKIILISKPIDPSIMSEQVQELIKRSISNKSCKIYENDFSLNDDTTTVTTEEVINKARKIMLDHLHRASEIATTLFPQNAQCWDWKLQIEIASLEETKIIANEVDLGCRSLSSAF
jgi:hypothetical protein